MDKENQSVVNLGEELGKMSEGYQKVQISSCKMNK